MEPKFRDKTDAETYEDVKAGYHLPPEGVVPKVILDLGFHAGFTIVDYLQRFPGCYVYGVEMDEQNFDFAVANIGDVGAYSLINVAIATWDGEGDYTGTATNAFRLSPVARESGRVACLTLDTLIWRYIKGPIDFAKFDIEGTEREIFKKGGDWPSKIKSLIAELHDGYTVEEATEDLWKQGYSCVAVNSHPSAVYATRDE